MPLRVLSQMSKPVLKECIFREENSMFAIKLTNYDCHCLKSKLKKKLWYQLNFLLV